MTVWAKHEGKRGPCAVGGALLGRRQPDVRPSASPFVRRAAPFRAVAPRRVLPRVTEPPAPPPKRMRAPPAERGFIGAVGIVQICAWGSLFYSFPLIAEAMQAELGWSRTALYGAATLGLALSGFAAYPVGAAIDRGHGRAVMSLAYLAAAALLAAWSQVEALWTFYLVYAGLGTLHAATLYEPAFAVVARRFGPERARHGITALTLWGGFASTIFIPLIQMMIDALGWRGALLGLAAVNTVICAGLTFAVVDPALDRPAPPRDAAAPSALAGRRAVAWALRLPVFWLLMAATVAYAAAFSTLTFHLYPLLLERGLDTAAVVTVLAVIGPAQVAGRIAIWWLASEAPVRLIGSAIVAVFPIVVIGLMTAPPELAVVAAVAALYGAANGMMTIVRGLMIPEMVSRQAYGALNGALLAPMHVVQAAAPLAAAAIWQASGGYDAVLFAVLAATLILVLSFWGAAFAARGPMPGAGA